MKFCSITDQKKVEILYYSYSSSYKFVYVVNFERDNLREVAKSLKGSPKDYPFIKV